VVEGSVRRSGERLRLTAQLISAQDGSHLRSDTYDEPVGDQMWHPNAVARRLPPHDLDTIWVVAFQRIVADNWIYAAAHLKFLGKSVPTWLVCISPDFTAWSVKRTR
jgi:hypothetical protein